jgi:hypothetical protein
MTKLIALTAVLGLGLFLYGCGDETATTASNEPAAPTAALPANLIATTAPAEAKEITAAKTSAKAGDAIVIKGMIGGTENPLATNRAMMTILDSSVKTCDSMPGDACKTPWDACCEPAEVRTAKSATVQVVGADGKPLHATLKGVGGIEPLKKVVVSGVAKPSGDALIVEAKEIYVQP